MLSNRMWPIRKGVGRDVLLEGRLIAKGIRFEKKLVVPLGNRKTEKRSVEVRDLRVLSLS